MQAAVPSDCVGKLYGSPGCPTRPPNASSQAGGGPLSGTNSCGNAILEDPEECDQGRFNGKAECSTSCKLLYCGDGFVMRETGEECEPQTEEYYVLDKVGNLSTEFRFLSVTSSCGWFCKPPVCGADGKSCTGGCKWKYAGDCVVASSGAVLDSSSTSSGSAVASLSASSGSEAKAGLSPGSRSGASLSSVPVILCGNGVVDGTEECDDGNENPLDGCQNDCKKPLCGDGIVQKGEECDDKNAVNDDACTVTCARPRCGDGIVQKGEACDSGLSNANAKDACRTTCVKPVCGDGILDGGEECDNGGQNADAVPDACRTTCKRAKCGDRVQDAGEYCDDGNAVDADECSLVCTRPVCGDGVVQKGEECDWGPRNDDRKPNACRSGCKLPRCGDSVTDSGEECDPPSPLSGGDVGGRNCSATCAVLSESFTSSAAPPSVPGASPPGALPLPVMEQQPPPAGGGSSGRLVGAAVAAAAILLAILAFVYRASLRAFLGKKAWEQPAAPAPPDQSKAP